MMEGDIQPDGNTVFVSAVTMPMFNGAPAPDILSVFGYNSGLGYGSNPPEPFVAANWTLTQKAVASVPEPTATLSLVALGVFGAVSRIKRK